MPEAGNATKNNRMYLAVSGVSSQPSTPTAE